MTNPVAVIRATQINGADLVGVLGAGGDWRQGYADGSTSPIDVFSPINISDLNDSTFLYDTSSGLTRIGYWMQTLALPPLSQIIRVRIVTRLKSLFTGSINVETYLAQGSNTSATDNYTDSSTTVVQKTGAWQTTAPDGGAWTPDKVSSTRLVLLNNGASAPECAWIDLWVEVEYNQAPTAAFTDPIYDEVITDNARPQFQWTYADPEADTQAKWRCLVFSSPQSDPGGNAGAALADSTLTVNANTSWTPSVLLPDGQLYAYVQVTDAIGTVSAWNVVRFTVNVNPPAVQITSPMAGQTITATDKPTFRWNFTDAGGDAQDRWIGYIFTTQVNDPDASSGAALVSSGETFSPASSWTLANSLPNGNYWLYVKAGNDSAGGRYSSYVGVPFTMAVAPPTVAFTAPTANAVITDTNRPSFSWSFASALGYPQEKWQILVFLSGQTDPVAAVGSAVLNSGEEFSTATSWTAPTGLSNGVYYAYIRVADVGTNSYSSWASVTFSVNALPPAIPYLTTNASPVDFPATAGVPSVQVSVLTAENALDTDTASLETSIGTWIAGTNGVLSRPTADATYAKKGSRWLALTASAAGQARANTGSYAITAGRYVSVGAWVRPSVTARSVWARIDWYQGSVLLSSTGGPQYTEVVGHWIQVEATGVAPSSADHAVLNWIVEGAAASEVHNLDCAYLRVTPNQTAFTNIDDPNFIWPINLFGAPTFQDDILPSDSAAMWQLYNDEGADPDPLFWHSGDTSIPSVSAPLAPRILDLAGLPTAIKAAFSVCRKLRRAYSGNAATVYRLSDAATLSIGFTSTGDVDWSSLIAWAGTSKVYLKELFDQSVNGFHLIQNTNSHQFLLFDGTHPMTNGTLQKTCAAAEDAARGMATAAFAADTTSKLSAVVVGEIPSGGGGSLGGKMENLVDDFSSANTSQWNGYSNPGVSLVSGQLNLTPGTTYQSILSVANYDLTGSFFEMQIIQRGSTATGVETGMAASVDDNNQFAMFLTGTSLFLRERAAGTNNDTSVTYNASTMPYWRIREASGTIYWETSSNGTTWTTQRSKTSAITGALTSMEGSIYAGYWSTAPSPNPNFIVDNVNTASASGEAPRLVSVYGSTATDSTDAKGAVLIGRQGQSAATTITRNSASRASHAFTFSQQAMFSAVIDETTDTYTDGVDGATTAGSTYNGGAFNYTNISTGFDGTNYASVAGMSFSEIYVYDDTLSAAALSLMQANIINYFGTPQIPVSGGSGTTGTTGSTAYDTRFTLVASDDMSSDPRSEWVFYDFGTATSYVADSWMARNVTYNASGKYLDFKAWKNGTHREGVGGFWNLPAAAGAGMAWELDFDTDDSIDYGVVFLTWPVADGNWPIDGEIDVEESYAGGGKTSTGESNFHEDTVVNSGRHLMAPSSSSSLTGCISGDIAAGDYRVDLTKLHTWRVEWVFGVSIAVYVDGQLRAKTTDTSYVPHTIKHRPTVQQEFYNINDSSVSSTWEAHTRIYGIRAYKFTG